MPKGTPSGPSARSLASELNRMRKRIERGEAKTKELKAMVNTLEKVLDEILEE